MKFDGSQEKNHILLSTFVREELHIDENSCFGVIHEGSRLAGTKLLHSIACMHKRYRINHTGNIFKNFKSVHHVLCF